MAADLADQIQPVASNTGTPQPLVESLRTAKAVDNFPLAKGQALVRKLRNLTSRLPTAVPMASGTDAMACFRGNPSAAVQAGEDPWESVIDPQLNRVIGFGKKPEEIARIIRRGPLGMDGFCTWIEHAIFDLRTSPELLELRIERVFDAMKLL
jgi:hypothetical protein